MSKVEHTEMEQLLFNDISHLIEESKAHVAATVNTTLTFLYWKIGNRINKDILQNRRARYGEKIVVSLTRQLEAAYGKGFDEKNIRRMMQFAVIFPEEEIVVSLIRQLTWTHIIALLPLKDPLQREFYAEMCRIERWSVKVLREKIDGMMYARTAISKKAKTTDKAGNKGIAQR